MDEIRDGLGERLFAVNVIVHRSNDRLEEDLAVIVDKRVPIVITSLGMRAEVMDAIHSYGGVVLHDVTSDDFARKAADRGADGIIAVAAGAGGHPGRTSPFALLDEIRRWYAGPVGLSGAIASGRSLLSAQAAGADFGYAGSAFIATHESGATHTYREMVVNATSADIVGTALFAGTFANYLRQSIEACGLKIEDLPARDVNAAETWGLPKAWRDVLSAGQGVGATTSVTSVAQVVNRLASEYQLARGHVARLLATE